MRYVFLLLALLATLCAAAPYVPSDHDKKIMRAYEIERMQAELQKQFAALAKEHDELMAALAAEQVTTATVQTTHTLGRAAKAATKK